MTVNGDPWTLTAGFACGFRPPWQTAAEISVVLLAMVGSILLLVVLVEKARHKELLNRMMPRSAVRKLNRGVTVAERYDDEPVTGRPGVRRRATDASQRHIIVLACHGGSDCWDRPKAAMGAVGSVSGASSGDAAQLRSGA